MKRWIKTIACACSLMAVTFFADAYEVGTYTTAINGHQYELELKPGPFGPGEQGNAALYVDGQIFKTYAYEADYEGDVMLVDVPGLGHFEVKNGVMHGYIDTGITLTQKQSSAN